MNQGYSRSRSDIAAKLWYWTSHIYIHGKPSASQHNIAHFFQEITQLIDTAAKERQYLAVST